MDFNEYFAWFIPGSISLLLVIVWYAVREWIKGVKSGFTKIFEKFDELIHAIDKIDMLSQIQNERISNLSTQIDKHEKIININTERISSIETKQIACKNFHSKLHS